MYDFFTGVSLLRLIFNFKSVAFPMSFSSFANTAHSSLKTFLTASC